MTRRLRSRSVPLSGTFAALTGTILATAGCAEEPPEARQVSVPAYCVTHDNTIVGTEYCDGDETDEHDHDATGVVVPYWIIYGNNLPVNAPLGTKLPQAATSSGSGVTRIGHTNVSGRTAVGLPASGGFGSTATVNSNAVVGG